MGKFRYRWDEKKYDRFLKKGQGKGRQDDLPHDELTNVMYAALRHAFLVPVVFPQRVERIWCCKWSQEE